MTSSDEFEAVPADDSRAHRPKIRSSSRWFSRVLPLFLPAILFLASPPPARSQAVWVIDTLDATAQVTQLSLAIDSLDRLHASYQVEDAPFLYYGTWESGVWATELVTERGGSGSIAVTSDGIPSISYGAMDTLRLASRTVTDWTIEVGDAVHGVSGTPALGLRSNGQADVGYVEGFGWTAKYFRHATRSETGWSDERLSVGMMEETDGDISIGSDDFPRAIFPEFFAAERSKLVLATLDGVAWEKSTIDSAPYAGSYLRGIHTGLDAGDRPHIAYLRLFCDFESCEIHARYGVQNESGGWDKFGIESVYNGWSTNENSWIDMHDIAIDPDGVARVVYLKGIDSTGVQAESLLVAHRAAGVWQKECVLSDDVQDAALEIGSDGTFYVLFSLPGPQSGLYLARRIDATSVADAPRPSQGLRLSVTPNPMRGGGTISFALGAGSASPSATLSIYDIRGRVMRSFESVTPFGALSWDGADNAGRPVAPGVYFVRLNGGAGSAVSRVAIVR
jgi:hypothetical protein